jgi:DNA-binding transcriptional LysR family regulator
MSPLPVCVVALCGDWSDHPSLWSCQSNDIFGWFHIKNDISFMAEIDPPSPLQTDWYLRGPLRLRQLRLLIVLGEVNHIGDAARLLSTTQPAVSKMLAELEKLVGTPLFTRTARGTFPTPHGDSMIRHAAWILGDLDRMGRDWNASAASRERIHLGINSSSAAYLVPHALVQLQAIAPELTVVVREGSIETLLPDLLTRKLDLIVARVGPALVNADLTYTTLGDAPMCVVASADHPLARRKTCTWQDLAEWPWILPPDGSPVRTGLDALFLHHGIRPRAHVESASVLNNLVTMQQSPAVSLMPTPVATYHAKRQGLRMLPIPLPPLFGPTAILQHRALALSSGMQAVIDCLKRVALNGHLVPTD